MVVLNPDPVEVVPPGDLVKVHESVPGKLFNTTLPVGTAHVGCVLVPTVGADGETGAVLMTKLDDEEDMHPDASVTV